MNEISISTLRQYSKAGAGCHPFDPRFLSARKTHVIGFARLFSLCKEDHMSPIWPLNDFNTHKVGSFYCSCCNIRNRSSLNVLSSNF